MDNSDRRIYRISPWRRSLLGCVVGPFIVTMLVGGLYFFNEPEGKAMVTTASLIFVIVLPFQIILHWTRLEFSPRGVRLRQVGYSLESGWNEIAAIRVQRGREGFVTTLPMTGKGAQRLALFRGLGVGRTRFYDDEQRALLRERKLIPIEAFAWFLRKGTMRDEIAKFAPHLSKDLEGLD